MLDVLLRLHKSWSSRATNINAEYGPSPTTRYPGTEGLATVGLHSTPILPQQNTKGLDESPAKHWTTRNDDVTESESDTQGPRRHHFKHYRVT
jgi:hypothetical protein